MNRDSALDRSQRLLSEAILDVLEEVVSWDPDTQTSCELPVGLRDPAVMMERLRQLMENDRNPPLSRAPESLESESDLEEYRAAARNGSSIPDDVLRRMHQERERAEAACVEGG